MAPFSQEPTALESEWSREAIQPWRGASKIGTRVAALPTWFWLGTIVALSTLFRFASGLQTPAPWILPDELIYSELAKSFAASGDFAVRGQPFSVISFGPLYPVVMAPIYRFAHTAPEAYAIVKAVNSLLMSTAAIPAYFIGRRLLTRRSALMLAASAVLLPSMIYATKLMTESVAYPLFLLAVLAMLRVLEQATERRQLVALAAIGLASLARIQMIVLLPALVASQVLLAALDARRSRSPLWSAAGRSLAKAWIVAGLPAFAVAAFATLETTRGTSLWSLLGSHDVASGRLHPFSLLTSMLYHAADLDLYVGVAPLAAAGVLLMHRHAGNEGDTLQPFLVLSALVSVGLLAVAAVYLTTLPTTTPRAQEPHVYDRYVFYLVPLILAAFLVWLERGLPRPRIRAAAVAAAVAVLPLALPYSSLLTGREWGVSSSNVALVPWGILRLATGSGVSLIVGAVGIYAALLAFGFLRAAVSGRGALALAVLVNLALSASAVQIGNASVAESAAAYGVGRDSGWVDAAVGPHAHVIAVWSGNRRRTWHGWYGIWENEMLNQSVAAVYHLYDPMPYDPPGTGLVQRGGVLILSGAPLRTHYLLTDDSLGIDGPIVAADAPTHMVLYRVNGIVRLR